ncbi:MAG: ThiF family adenylyltransferase, partial [Bacteroidota bacterium]|nr:ThiF family adenylyltransferase [Bacteroidota bacterium]
KSTEGLFKTDIVAQRITDINHDVNLTVINDYLCDDKTSNLLKNKFDYIVDAIDTLSPKVYLIYEALKLNHKIVSSMGSGSRMNPEYIKVADISKTYNCPFAYDIRKRLHKLGIFKGLKAVFSSETIMPDTRMLIENEKNKKSIVGTISYMPVIFGCYCASVVINDILSVNN